ncbi:zinc ribbon domain-containing protein [Cellulophaga sp. Z1A5H]|uniref:zinc ribbon domain-containing protein n=1 Tax=Cellulophaga sp. Z1A5H TaxID=2687291 RepID=UPI0013FDE5B4|nr:zinc ribbon domain-containing protein [Cellulophaga sp. Z1A5H]
MNCIACSTENIPSALFCKNCGAKLVPQKNQNNEDVDKIVNLFMLIIGSGLVVSLFYFFINLIEYIDIYSITPVRIITSLVVPVVTLVAAILMPHQKAKVFLFVAFTLEIIFFIRYSIL